MPAAIAIPAIVGAASAGASVVGAKMQSNAAKKAAQTQVDASNQALGRYEQINRPYLDLGQSAATTLGRVMQPGMGYSPQQQRADVMGSAYRPNQPISAQLGESPSPFMQAMGPMGQTVKIASPDGSEVRDVPRQQAQMYLSRGGRIVG